MPLSDVYWLDRDRPPGFPPLTGDSGCDVAVVGGGFTGLWTALLLAESAPNLRVTVLEARSLGCGASGRNGGFLDPSLTHGLANGVRHFPDEIERLEELGRGNYADFRASLDRHAIDCSFEPTGMLEVAAADWQVAELRESADLHRRYGHTVEWLDASEAQERLASPLVRAALRRPDAGGVLDPVALVDGLAAACARLGVTLHEQSAVTALRPTPSGVDVVTTGGVLTAGQVVVGADAWTATLLRPARRRYVTVYDYVLMTAPLTADQLARIGWKGREGVSDSGNRFHYFRLTADDRILWGGYDAVRHRGDAVGDHLDRWPPTHDRLEQHFREFFPQLPDVPFTHRWGGPIAVSTRFTPAFGVAHGGRVRYAVGYTGLGVAASRFAARVLTDGILARQSDLLDLRFVRKAPFPFPPEPLRTAAVAMTQRAIAAADDNDGRRGAWLRVLDRVGVGFDS